MPVVDCGSSHVRRGGSPARTGAGIVTAMATAMMSSREDGMPGAAPTACENPAHEREVDGRVYREAKLRLANDAWRQSRQGEKPSSRRMRW